MTSAYLVGVCAVLAIPGFSQTYSQKDADDFSFTQDVTRAREALFVAFRHPEKPGPDLSGLPVTAGRCVIVMRESSRNPALRTACRELVLATGAYNRLMKLKGASREALINGIAPEVNKLETIFKDREAPGYAAGLSAVYYRRFSRDAAVTPLPGGGRPPSTAKTVVENSTLSTALKLAKNLNESRKPGPQPDPSPSPMPGPADPKAEAQRLAGLYSMVVAASKADPARRRAQLLAVCDSITGGLPGLIGSGSPANRALLASLLSALRTAAQPALSTDPGLNGRLVAVGGTVARFLPEFSADPLKLSPSQLLLLSIFARDLRAYPAIVAQADLKLWLHEKAAALLASSKGIRVAVTGLIRSAVSPSLYCHTGLQAVDKDGTVALFCPSGLIMTSISSGILQTQYNPDTRETAYWFHGQRLPNMEGRIPALKEDGTLLVYRQDGKQPAGVVDRIIDPAGNVMESTGRPGIYLVNHKTVLVTPAAFQKTGVRLGDVPMLSYGQRRLVEAFLTHLPSAINVFQSAAEESGKGGLRCEGVRIGEDGRVRLTLVALGPDGKPLMSVGPGGQPVPVRSIDLVAEAREDSVHAFYRRGNEMLKWVFFQKGSSDKPVPIFARYYSPKLGQYELKDVKVWAAKSQRWVKAFDQGIRKTEADPTEWGKLSAAADILKQEVVGGLGTVLEYVMMPFQSAVFFSSAKFWEVLHEVVYDSRYPNLETKLYPVYTRAQQAIGGQDMSKPGTRLSVYRQALRAAARDGAFFESLLDKLILKGRKAHYGEAYETFGYDKQGIDEQERADMAAQLFGLGNLPSRFIQDGLEAGEKGDVFAQTVLLGMGGTVAFLEGFAEGLLMGAAFTPARMALAARAFGLSSKELKMVLGVTEAANVKKLAQLEGLTKPAAIAKLLQTCPFLVDDAAKLERARRAMVAFQRVSTAEKYLMQTPAVDAIGTNGAFLLAHWSDPGTDPERRRQAIEAVLTNAVGVVSLDQAVNLARNASIPRRTVIVVKPAPVPAKSPSERLGGEVLDNARRRVEEKAKPDPERSPQKTAAHVARTSVDPVGVQMLLDHYSPNGGPAEVHFSVRGNALFVGKNRTGFPLPGESDGPTLRFEKRDNHWRLVETPESLPPALEPLRSAFAARPPPPSDKVGPVASRMTAGGDRRPLLSWLWPGEPKLAQGVLKSGELIRPAPAGTLPVPRRPPSSGPRVSRPPPERPAAPLSPEAALDIAARASIPGRGDPDYGGARVLTREFLAEQGLTPRVTVEVKGARVHLSEPYRLNEGQRTAVVAYVETPQGTVVRSFYRSSSQGAWRVASHRGENGWIGKGTGEETTTLPAKLQVELNRLLEGREARTLKESDANTAFYGGLENDIPADFAVKPVRVGPPAKRVGAPDPAAYDIARWPDPAQAPDFSKPVGRSSFKHTLDQVGQVEVFVFRSKNGELDYLFNRDASGRTWLGGVEKVGGGVNSFGAPKVPVKAGELSMPAVEYAQQIPRGFAEETISGHYADATRFVHGLEIVRQFRRYLEGERDVERAPLFVGGSRPAARGVPGAPPELAAAVTRLHELVRGGRLEEAGRLHVELRSKLEALTDSPANTQLKHRFQEAGQRVYKGNDGGLGSLLRNYWNPAEIVRAAAAKFEAARRRPGDWAGSMQAALRALQGGGSDCVARSIWEHPGLAHLRGLPEFAGLPAEKAYLKFREFASKVTGEDIARDGLSARGQQLLFKALGLTLEPLAESPGPDALVKTMRAQGALLGSIVFREGGGYFRHKVVVSAAYREAGGPWQFVVLDSNFRYPRTMIYEQLQLLNFQSNTITPQGPKHLAQMNIPVNAPSRVQQLETARAALRDPEGARRSAEAGLPRKELELMRRQNSLELPVVGPAEKGEPRPSGPNAASRDGSPSVNWVLGWWAALTAKKTPEPLPQVAKPPAPPAAEPPRVIVLPDITPTPEPLPEAVFVDQSILHLEKRADPEVGKFLEGRDVVRPSQDVDSVRKALLERHPGIAEERVDKVIANMDAARSLLSSKGELKEKDAALVARIMAISQGMDSRLVSVNDGLLAQMKALGSDLKFEKVRATLRELGMRLPEASKPGDLPAAGPRGPPFQYEKEMLPGYIQPDTDEGWRIFNAINRKVYDRFGPGFRNEAQGGVVAVEAWLSYLRKNFGADPKLWSLALEPHLEALAETYFGFENTDALNPLTLIGKGTNDRRMSLRETLQGLMNSKNLSYSHLHILQIKVWMATGTSETGARDWNRMKEALDKFCEFRPGSASSKNYREDRLRSALGWLGLQLTQQAGEPLIPAPLWTKFLSSPPKGQETRDFDTVVQLLRSLPDKTVKSTLEQASLSGPPAKYRELKDGVITILLADDSLWLTAGLSREELGRLRAKMAEPEAFEALSKEKFLENIISLTSFLQKDPQGRRAVKTFLDDIAQSEVHDGAFVYRRTPSAEVVGKVPPAMRSAWETDDSGEVAGVEGLRYHATNDPAKMIVKMGLEPEPNCQRATEETDFNKQGQLLYRVRLYQTAKVIYWVDENGRTVAQADLELVLGKDGRPGLFVEHLYLEAESKLAPAQLAESVLAHAEKLGVPQVFFNPGTWGAVPGEVGPGLFKTFDAGGAVLYRDFGEPAKQDSIRVEVR